MPFSVYSFVLWATLIMLAAMVVGVLLARYFRKWSREANSSGGAPFTLHDLRTMRAGGQITQAEYEAMREAIIGQVASRKSVDGRRAADAAANGPPEGPGD